MIGLGEVRESKHVEDGSSPISLNFHACLNLFLSLITLGKRFMAGFRIPSWAWLLRMFSVHAVVDIKNWRSLSMDKFPITTISIGRSRSIFLYAITSSRWIFSKALRYFSQRASRITSLVAEMECLLEAKILACPWGSANTDLAWWSKLHLFHSLSFIQRKKKYSRERESESQRTTVGQLMLQIESRPSLSGKWVKSGDLCFVILDLWLFCVSFLFRLDCCLICW